MRDFNCPNCGQRLAFENSTCLNCGSALGFSLDQMALLVIAEENAGEHAGFVDAAEYQLCANLQVWPNAIGWYRSTIPGCCARPAR